MAERNYNLKDSVLLEWGDVIIAHLTDDIKHFSNFDPKLDITFLEDLEQKVTQGYKESGDQLNILQLQQKTESLKNEMIACRNYFKKLRYWVLEAFEKEKVIQKQFGIGRFKNIRNNQSKMMQYMEGLTDTINQHRDALVATGIPIPLLEQPPILSKNLRTINKEQEHKKRTRTVDTAKRIKQLNELYALLQKVNTIADTIFDKQSAKRQLYRTPKSKTKTKTIHQQEE
ncbi:hypothetical protein [Aquimarina longa]|uniref:hypothetical protein n=1 Tax=Aquimarina longa TaxID=1080221 RepID=UPI00078360D7|nr:hypothetical protein [Aquimarina longa]